MKRKLQIMALFSLVVIVSVAYAARNRGSAFTFVVHPLAGYADQLGSGGGGGGGDYLVPAGDLMAPASQSLLDEPTQ